MKYNARLTTKSNTVFSSRYKKPKNDKMHNDNVMTAKTSVVMQPATNIVATSCQDRLVKEEESLLALQK
jgi:hypothetical protein